MGIPCRSAAPKLSACREQSDLEERRSAHAHHSFVEMSASLLGQGYSVRFQAPGTSMHPAIRDGDLITVAPVAPRNVRRGDVVLCRAARRLIAHRVMRIERKDGQPRFFILRGDASHLPDMPVASGHVLGKVVRVERDGRPGNPNSRRIRTLTTFLSWALRLRFCLKQMWRALPLVALRRERAAHP